MKKGTLVQWTCIGTRGYPHVHNRYGKILRVRGRKVEVECADTHPNEWLLYAECRPIDPHVKTRFTHPEHPVVGHRFAGFGRGVGAQTEIFYCDSHDPAIGYWMTNIEDAGDRTNISERAVGRTWFEAYDEDDHYWVSNWAVRVPKKPAPPVPVLPPEKPSP